MSPNRFARRLAIVGAACTLLAAIPPPASAAVTVGETFVPTSLCSYTTAGSTVVGSTSPAAPAPQFSLPADGVITSWSFQAGPNVPPFIRLKVLRGSGTNFATIGHSALEIPLANQVNTYPTRVPAKAGDVIGDFAATAASVQCARSLAGYSIGFTAGDTPDGSSAAFVNQAGFELSISATLEPDADNDGYGDETQDLCPTDADTQKACTDKTAPQTTIDKKPKKRTAKRKAKLIFSSDDPSASFLCSLDGKAFKPCGSPQKLKVKSGRHTFTVLAVDAAGNVDSTPATASWTVE